MKKIINDKGFKKAMRTGKTWTTLDCQLTETKDGRWYWEIDKTVFSTNEGEIGGVTEQLGFGEDDDSLETVTKIWNNLIEKYNPDEYFVDQF